MLYWKCKIIALKAQLLLFCPTTILQTRYRYSLVIKHGKLENQPFEFGSVWFDDFPKRITRVWSNGISDVSPDFFQVKFQCFFSNGKSQQKEPPARTATWSLKLRVGGWPWSRCFRACRSVKETEWEKRLEMFWNQTFYIMFKFIIYYFLMFIIFFKTPIFFETY